MCQDQRVCYATVSVATIFLLTIVNSNKFLDFSRMQLLSPEMKLLSPNDQEGRKLGVTSSKSSKVVLVLECSCTT